MKREIFCQNQKRQDEYVVRTYLDVLKSPYNALLFAKRVKIDRKRGDDHKCIFGDTIK